MNRKNLEAILMWVLLAMTFAGFALWNLYAPMGRDDFYFTTMVPDGDMEAYSACEGRPIESFSDAVDNVGQVFLYDSGRWPNLLHVLFVPAPSGVERVFTAVVLALVLFLMMKRGSVGGRVAMPVSVLSVVFLWSALPWYDNLDSLAYQANYIWMSALVLVFMLFADRIMTMGRYKFGILLLLAFAAGEGHEGFGICAGVWFAATALAEGRLKSRRVWMVLLSMALGLCVNLYSGTFYRLGLAFGSSYNPGAIRYCISRLISQAWPFWLALMLCGVEIMARRTFRIPGARVVYPLLSGAFASLCVAVAVMYFGRALWPLDLFSSLVAVIILSRWLGRVPALIWAFLSVIFVIVYAWWLTELVRWERIYGEEHAAIMASMEQGRDDCREVYAGSHTPSGKAPWYLMGISRNQFDEVDGRRWARSYFSRSKSRVFLVASDPAMLGPFEEWPLIPGNAGVRGVWPMIAVADTTASDHLVFTIGAPTGNETPVDRLLILLKEGPEPSVAGIPLGVVWHPLAIAGQTEVYAVETEPLPRTLKLRDVIRIDTVAATR